MNQTPHVFPRPVRPECLSDLCHGGPIPPQLCDCPECRSASYRMMQGIAHPINTRARSPRKEAR